MLLSLMSVPVFISLCVCQLPYPLLQFTLYIDVAVALDSLKTVMWTCLFLTLSILCFVSDKYYLEDLYISFPFPVMFHLFIYSIFGL